MVAKSWVAKSPTAVFSILLQNIEVVVINKVMGLVDVHDEGLILLHPRVAEIALDRRA